jgi:hypothetical protein
MARKFGAKAAPTVAGGRGGDPVQAYHRLLSGQIAKAFALFTTVQAYFHRFCRGGTLERIDHALVMMARELSGREPPPLPG